MYLHYKYLLANPPVASTLSQGMLVLPNSLHQRDRRECFGRLCMADKILPREQYISSNILQIQSAKIDFER